LVAADGTPIAVFSSQNPATVARHFEWMARFEITGAAQQRFIGQLIDPRRRVLADRVLQNVRAAANQHQRSLFVMYDVSGLTAATLPVVLDDFRELVGRGILDDPAWQHHGGAPVIGLWGLGFASRANTPEDAHTLIRGVREIAGRPITLMGGVPRGWRTFDADAKPDSTWRYVYRELDVLSPWTVGAFRDDVGADNHARQRLALDLQEARLHGQEYMPVIWPGFSWRNLRSAGGFASPLNEIPRRCGGFFWRQGANAIRSGASMIYVAMFDEVNESTAILPLVSRLSRVPAGFLAGDFDGCAGGEWRYLRLTRELARGLISGETPDVPPQLQ
jgi:hypothetical protein